jgi:hypothetical protein
LNDASAGPRHPVSTRPSRTAAAARRTDRKRLDRCTDICFTDICFTDICFTDICFTDICFTGICFTDDCIRQPPVYADGKSGRSDKVREATRHDVTITDNYQSRFVEGAADESACPRRWKNGVRFEK